MRSKQLISRCIFVLSGASFTSLAYGQASEKAAAEALFQSGMELTDQGQHVEACKKFEASQKLDPAVGTLLHLGDCYERTGRTASAWATFREAASVAQVSGQEQRHEIATTRANALEPKLSHVQIRVPAAHRIDGLTIVLAGVSVPQASIGVPIPVDPGEQRLTASAPRHQVWTSTVVVGAPGAPLAVDIPKLEPLPDVSVTAPRVRAPEPITPAGSARVSRAEGSTTGDGQRLAGIIIGGVGLSGLVVGAILGAQAMNKNDDSLEECRPNDSTLCSPLGIAQREDAERFALGSTIGFIAGGALAATGLIVFVAAPSDEVEAVMRSVRPMVGQQGGGIAVGGAW